MTLDEAYKVAKAVGDCIDPPVINGIFSSLNEAFPEFNFKLGEGKYACNFSVTHVSGAQRRGNIYE